MGTFVVPSSVRPFFLLWENKNLRPSTDGPSMFVVRQLCSLAGSRDWPPLTSPASQARLGNRNRTSYRGREREIAAKITSHSTDWSRLFAYQTGRPSFYLLSTNILYQEGEFLKLLNSISGKDNSYISWHQYAGQFWKKERKRKSFMNLFQLFQFSCCRVPCFMLSKLHAYTRLLRVAM